MWILFLNTNGTVNSYDGIDNSSGDIPEPIGAGALFGTSVDYANDIDGDGVGDILVGSLGDDDEGLNSGAVWVLFMKQDGTVAMVSKLKGTDGDTDIVLNDDDYFGTSVAFLGMAEDTLHLAIGAIRADDGGMDRGVVWVPNVITCAEDFIANAGVDQIFCDVRTTATLNATPPEVGTGWWSMANGTGVLKTNIIHRCHCRLVERSLKDGFMLSSEHSLTATNSSPSPRFPSQMIPSSLRGPLIHLSGNDDTPPRPAHRWRRAVWEPR